MKKRHKKKYANSGHHSASLRRWKQRKSVIDKHNREADQGKLLFRMTDNEFADNVSLSFSFHFGCFTIYEITLR